MSEIVTVIVGENAHQVSRRVANTMIQMAKEVYTERKVNAIVAVEQGKAIEMRKDVFTEEKVMKAWVKEYKSKGFKVHYVRKW